MGEGQARPTADPQRRPWLQRNLLWLLPAGCVGVLVLLLAGVALVMVGAFAGLKSSWPYNEAVRLARENPSVVEALGEPIRTGWLVGGSMRVQHGSRDAELAIPIRGPDNSGTIHVVATRRRGEWKFEVAVVEVRGRQEPIDLLAERDRLRVDRMESPAVGRPRGQNKYAVASFAGGRSS